MATDPNLMKAADFAKVSEIDFVNQFSENVVNSLSEMLGITRKIEKTPGNTIKAYRVVGTLEDGTVAEGEEIPLSKYKTEVVDTFELTVKKYRKTTTFEAINDKGYEQAVTDTDTKMITDIQKGIRSDFITFLATGEGRASGVGLQGALAQTWGQLKVLFEDYDVAESDLVYFVNPLDIANYLTDQGIPTPSMVRHERELEEGRMTKRSIATKWTDSMVKDLLDNDFYSNIAYYYFCSMVKKEGYAKLI